MKRKIEEVKKLQKRLEAFYAFVGTAPKGSLKDVDLKDVRAERVSVET